MEVNKYQTGSQQASISDSTWVKAAWGRGDGAANRLRMLNGAFEIYFILKNSINNHPDASIRLLMQEELDDAGRNGWGTGVQDLDDAFVHWLQPGPWTDDQTGSYMRAGTGIFGAQTPSIKGAKFCWGLPTNIMPGPLAAKNFFEGLDDRLSDLSSAIGNHNSEVAKLRGFVEAKNAQSTGDTLSKIAKVAKGAQKLMFLAPKPNDSFLTDVMTGGMGSVTGGSQRDSFAPAIEGGGPVKAGMSPSVSLAGVTFLQATQDIDKFLTVHKQAMNSGIFDNKTSTEFALLAVALGRVPVLGGFYAEIVSNLPGFFAGMNNLFQEHYRAIDRMTRVN